MEAEFRQDLNKRTMVVKRNSDGKKSFKEKMAVKNRIKGTAVINIRYLNGESFYCYDMGSYQTLKKVFDGRSMSFGEMKKLLSGLVSVSAELEKYLLDINDLLMDPDQIFWDMEKEEPVFCYYPGKGKEKEGVILLGQFLMDCVDKNDENAVKTAYAWFDRICDGIILPTELLGSEDLYKSCGNNEENEEAGTETEVYGEGNMDGEYIRTEVPDHEQQREGNYYLEEMSDKEEGEEKKENPLFLLLAFVPALLSAAVYGIVFFHPDIMLFLGLSDRDYIRAGAGVTVFSGAFITAGIYFWNKRRRQSFPIRNE